MIALRAGRVLVEGEQRADTCVTIDGDRIVAVGAQPERGASVIDLGGLELIPGLVDLHSDCLEERAHPRPGRDLPLPAALLQLDAEAAAWGITTNFVCATIEDDPLQHRSTARAAETVRCLESLRQRMRVEHHVHLRVEVTSEALGVVRELAALDVVALISYMHHAPGHGQFAGRDDAWREIYAPGFQGTDAELRRLVADRRRRAAGADERRAEIAAIARDTGTPLASHDDEEGHTVHVAAELGARISEFPLTHGAAAEARRLGLGVVMGAPNAWRGGSHLGGPDARDILAAGHLSALVSDYHPPSLLAAAYALADDGIASWSDALALVSTSPARLAGLGDRGTIAPGRRADLVAVERIAGHPVVRQTWRAGVSAFAAAALPHVS